MRICAIAAPLWRFCRIKVEFLVICFCKCSFGTNNADDGMIDEGVSIMQNLLDTKDYMFDFSPEVKEKIEHFDKMNSVIDEDAIKDLTVTYVQHKAYWWFKRVIDVAVSIIGLIVLSPLFLIIAGVVFVDDPGRVVFSQYRIGMHGKRFKLYKFRTMKTETPKYLSTSEIENPEQYLTGVGHFLRKTSLDELPQLYNVLKGDMSLIGPRPLIADEFEIHAMRMRFGVYTIRPGVTGLAQINGRDIVSPSEKVRWDVKYLQQYGFFTDVKILLETIPKIFGGDGVVEGSGKSLNVENSAQKESIQ